MAHPTQEAIEKRLGELAEHVSNMETVICGTHAVLRTIAYNGMLESLPEDEGLRLQQEHATRMLELAEAALRTLISDIDGSISSKLYDLQRGVI